MAILSHLCKFFFPLCLSSSLSPKLSFLFSVFFCYLSYFFNISLLFLYYPVVSCPPASFFLHLQSNSLLSESLRNSDKRRNGPEFPNDTKKRKVDDKDSSHYVRNCPEYVCLCNGFRKEKIISNVSFVML